jgi:multiple sugar transport system substrate-binding protein/raffinose/stachyose/melibiose transport system substrate-binding protein
MKLLRSVFVGLMCLVALAGCERASEPPAAQAPKTAITFLHYFTGSLSGGLDDMARVFNRQNPQFEIKAVSLDHEAFKFSIQDTLKSGQPPDLYSYWAGARTASLVEDLEPLDDVWRQAGLDQQFAASLVRAASDYQGHKVLLPLTQHYVAFFYNKKVFDAHGLKPPASWDEFLAVCAALKAKGVVPIALGARDKWPAQFWFDLLLLRTAPFEFRQALMAGEASYADPKVKAVFAQWAGLIERGYFNAKPNELAWDSGANEMVYQGTAAMTLMGTWNIGFFGNDAHRWVAGQDYDFFPFPRMTPDLPTVALGPIDGLVVPKKALNRDGAKQAVVYLAGVEAQQAISQGSGALAPNTQVPRAFYSEIQQRVLSAIEQSPQFAFNYDLATAPAVAELGLAAFSEFLAFPKAYPQILGQLDSDATARFQSLSTKP